jgi:hypothetical protein
MSPEFEPTAKISLLDMCQATDVNPCDPSFKATETNYNILNSKSQTYTESLRIHSKDFPLLVRY